jgi:hypothetical protein
MRAIPSRAAYHPHTKTTASLPGLPAYRTPCTHPSAATNIASLYQNRCSSQQRPPQGTARGDAPTSTLAAGLSTCSDFKIVAPSLVTVTLCPRPVDCRILSCKTNRPQPIISSIPGARHRHHCPPPIQYTNATATIPGNHSLCDLHTGATSKKSNKYPLRRMARRAGIPNARLPCAGTDATDVP